MANSVIRSDKDLFYSIMEKDPTAIKHIDDSLKDDSELFLRWIVETKDASCLQFISDSLKRDVTFWINVIQQSPEGVNFFGNPRGIGMGVANNRR